MSVVAVGPGWVVFAANGSLLKGIALASDGDVGICIEIICLGCLSVIDRQELWKGALARSISESAERAADVAKDHRESCPGYTDRRA